MPNLNCFGNQDAIFDYKFCRKNCKTQKIKDCHKKTMENLMEILNDE